MAKISVIVPVYKAESCLNELYERLVNSLQKITDDFEILLIEDCGGDNSWQIIKELSLKDPRVKGYQFSRNFGQHYGITAGLDHCVGDWVVVMDCDLQDPPEAIPELYNKAQEGFDVVLAKRKQRKDGLVKRFFSSAFYKVFSYLAGIEYDGEVGNFRIMSKKVVHNCRRMREQLRFFGGMVQWMGFPTTSIEIQHAERHAGKSSYTFRKLLNLAIDTIIAYSDKPLRVSIKLGFLIASLAILYGIFAVIRALIFHSSLMPGWSSLIVSIYLMGGIIIAILGVIGVYLGKSFDESKKRPLYIVREATVDSHE